MKKKINQKYYLLINYKIYSVKINNNRNKPFDHKKIHK